MPWLKNLQSPFRCPRWQLVLTRADGDWSVATVSPLCRGGVCQQSEAILNPPSTRWADCAFKTPVVTEFRLKSACLTSRMSQVRILYRALPNPSQCNTSWASSASMASWLRAKCAQKPPGLVCSAPSCPHQWRCGAYICGSHGFIEIGSADLVPHPLTEVVSVRMARR